MKKHYFTFGAILLFLSLLAFAFFRLRAPPEPVWEGRPLSAWLVDLTHGSSKEVREPAADAIRAIGSAAVPSLLRMMRTRQTSVDRLLARLSGAQKLVHFRFTDVTDAEVQRSRAWMGFQALGDKGDCAIPELGRMLKKCETAEMAVVLYALASISSNSVPVLLDALPYVRPERRCAILVAASRWPSQKAAIVLALRRLLLDHRQRPISADELLAFCQNDPNQSMTVLFLALADPELREPAITALAKDGIVISNGQFSK